MAGGRRVAVLALLLALLLAVAEGFMMPRLKSSSAARVTAPLKMLQLGGTPVVLPPVVAKPATAALALGRRVFLALPFPLKVIATILTTLFTLVLIEDTTDWVTAFVAKLQGKAPKAQVAELVQKPYTPTKTSVPIRFMQSDKEPVEYGAEVGAKLSGVAEDAAVVIQYDCRKGKCGTCSVKVGSRWIKACQASVPAPLTPGEVFEVIVPKAAISSSKFFSPRSFLDGVWNNALGMVGFVAQMRKADQQYQARLAREKAIAEKAKLKRQEKEGA